MVDPLLSTSSTMQSYHHLISGSVEIPLATTAGNSSSIGKEPVPDIIWMSATSSEVSDAEQGIPLYTNVLQGYNTVVAVCCTIE